MAGTDNKLELEGSVISALGNGFFTIKPTHKDGEIELGEVLCTISGKIRRHNIKVIEGDIVKIEVPVCDLTKGRIVYRERK